MFEGKKDGFDPVLKLLEENNVEALSQQLSIIINEARYVGPDNAEYNAFRINFSITILETINKVSFAMQTKNSNDTRNWFFVNLSKY